jgi:hypothetical protein
MSDDPLEELDLLLEVVRRPDFAGRTLEDRVAALEDRDAIRELIMAYGYLEDERRWDEMLELYTDDIERVLAGSLVETVRGKAALRDRLVNPVMQAKSGAAAASRSRVEQLGLRHLMAAEVIRLGPDRSTATATLHYTLVATRDDASGFARGSRTCSTSAGTSTDGGSAAR